MTSHKLVYGKSECHEFWEGQKLLIFRNLPETAWQSQIKENGSYKVIDDHEAFKKRKKQEPTLLSVTLSANSAGELAKKIENQEGVKIKFDFTQVYKGKIPMKRKKQSPPLEAIKGAKN